MCLSCKKWYLSPLWRSRWCQKSPPVLVICSSVSGHRSPQFTLNLDSGLWLCSVGQEEGQDGHQLLHLQNEMIRDKGSEFAVLWSLALGMTSKTVLPFHRENPGPFLWKSILATKVSRGNSGCQWMWDKLTKELISLSKLASQVETIVLQQCFKHGGFNENYTKLKVKVKIRRLCSSSKIISTPDKELFMVVTLTLSFPLSSLSR